MSGHDLSRSRAAKGQFSDGPAERPVARLLLRLLRGCRGAGQGFSGDRVLGRPRSCQRANIVRHRSATSGRRHIRAERRSPAAEGWASAGGPREFRSISYRSRLPDRSHMVQHKVNGWLTARREDRTVPSGRPETAIKSRPTKAGRGSSGQLLEAALPDRTRSLRSSGRPRTPICMWTAAAMWNDDCPATLRIRTGSSVLLPQTNLSLASGAGLLFVERACMPRCR